MSLQDASAGIPERLINGLDYSQLGTKFEAVTSKEDVHFFPASGNFFSPDGIRVLRFNLVTTSYIDPQSVRLQAVFQNLTGGTAADPASKRIIPLGPMSLMLSRCRVLAQGTVIEDQTDYARLQTLHHKWMSPFQFRDLCNESFEFVGGGGLGSQLANGSGDGYTFNYFEAGDRSRIQMPFLTLGIFNQPKYLPGRFLNLVLKCELTPDMTSWIDTTNVDPLSPLKWALSDISLVASCINLDPALDSMIADKVLTGEIPLPIRTWVTQSQMITDSSFNITMTRGVSRLATFVVTYSKADEPDQKESNILYFPLASQEECEHQLQCGIKKIPAYPVRGCKENYYRGKQALCVSATSQHAYSMNYPAFCADSYFAALDCEAVCGQAEMSGLNLRGGQQIFFKASRIGTAGAGGTHPLKAFCHLNYQAMVVMDASGVTLLE